MVHSIRLSGYSATTEGGKTLALGTAESYGIETLKIDTDAAWDGLTITATFVNHGSATKMLVSSDGTVIVPPEATAVATVAIPGRIVFAGVADGVQRISCDLQYRVMAHAPIDGTASKPTPNEWQQYIAETQKIINKAVPQEGNVGQVLTKTADGSEWADPAGGGSGGATFTPSVSPDGIISWTNDKGKPNPDPVNIKGPAGNHGEQGPIGPQGLPGKDGAPGPAGADGKTPVKGVDYWTNADQKSIVNDVLKALPTWSGGAY